MSQYSPVNTVCWDVRIVPIDCVAGLLGLVNTPVTPGATPGLGTPRRWYPQTLMNEARTTYAATEAIISTRLYWTSRNRSVRIVPRYQSPNRARRAGEGLEFERHRRHLAVSGRSTNGNRKNAPTRNVNRGKISNERNVRRATNSP